MIIKCLETFTRGNLSFVRVRSDDGAIGMGQMSPYNADISALVFHRQIAPHALGADALDPGNLADRIIEATYKFPGSYVCRALTGLDTALWD
ncbi:MAG TPA: mandelate racemase/muconate lactonizing enzyme family protein, partial [Anaerolineae bacterium]|nr:mandelate racemase/muconate lactonizing enzyme family protein [Anaerolineae bacterium]